MAIVYKNPWFQVEQEGKWYFLREPHSPNPAAILIEVENRGYVLCRVQRVAVGCECLELPRGYSQGDESGLDCAIREAREETGITVESAAVTALGVVHPNSSLQRIFVSIFHAKVPESAWDARQNGDGEVRSVELFSHAEFRRMIATGEVKDALALAAFARLVAKA